MDVDGGIGKGPGHVADPTGVVEVDVGDHHPGQVVGAESEPLQLGQQHRHRALTAGLDQHRGVPLDEVAGGHPLPSAEEGVQLDDAFGHHDAARGLAGSCGSNG